MKGLMKIYYYICASRTCGFVETTTYAPQYSKPCPQCGGQIIKQ